MLSILGMITASIPRLANSFRAEMPIDEALSILSVTEGGRIEKYPEGTLVALNEADTAQLKRIPGVGSGIAKMIVAYRNRLGGFVRLEQLQEIPHVDTCLNKWFVVQGTPFRKIRVNKDGLDKLRNHPYMDFYKAKAILEYRRKRGNIKGLSRLSLFEEFTEKDLQRLSPYLFC